MNAEERLNELREMEFLDEDQVIESFMLTLGCSREFAEDLFVDFSKEYKPVMEN